MMELTDDPLLKLDPFRAVMYCMVRQAWVLLEYFGFISGPVLPAALELSHVM